MLWLGEEEELLLLLYWYMVVVCGIAIGVGIFGSSSIITTAYDLTITIGI